MNARIVAALIAAGLIAAGCGSDGNAEAPPEARADATVVAQNFAFDPSTIELEPGASATIELDNRDEATHSFTIEALDVDVEAEAGKAVTAQVPAPDEAVQFFCRFHPEQMRGEITIAGAAGGGGGDENESGSRDGGGAGYDY